ncbi:MAG: slipin family protein [Spirochaetes bacterium]|nr:slipin family protein [Spirochaetota bacterium]
MYDIVMTVFIAELVWWGLWSVIALVKKAYAILVFLILSGACFAAGEWFLVRIFPYAAFALMLIPLLVLPPMVRIIIQYERAVLFRLGRMRAILEPGLNLVFPLGIDLIRKVDLRTFTIDVPKQEVITRDNVPVIVDAVVYFNVFDPDLAVNKVADYRSSTSYLGQTILRSVLGQHELDEMLSKRNELNDSLRELLDVATDPWGIKVTAVEIKAIELAEGMKRAIARQAEAERERRAKIIAAEGELQASEKLSQAAAVIGREASTIQLRYLQTLTEIAVEKNSTIIFPLPMEILKFFDGMSKK